MTIGRGHLFGSLICLAAALISWSAFADGRRIDATCPSRDVGQSIADCTDGIRISTEEAGRDAQIMPQRCPTACGAEVSYVNARSVEPVIDATNVAIAPAIDAATATEHYGEIAWDVPTRINVEQAVISNVALADQTEGAEKLMVAGASTSAANKSQRPPRGGNEELLK